MRLEAEARAKSGYSAGGTHKARSGILMYEDYKNPELYTTREDRIQVLMMSMRGTSAWYAAIVEKGPKTRHLR